MGCGPALSIGSLKLGQYRGKAIGCTMGVENMSRQIAYCCALQSPPPASPIMGMGPHLPFAEGSPDIGVPPPSLPLIGGGTDPV
jgi:hypothetical protein